MKRSECLLGREDRRDAEGDAPYLIMRDWNWAMEYEPEFCMATCIAMENFHPLKDKREGAHFHEWSGMTAENYTMGRVINIIN